MRGFLTSTGFALAMVFGAPTMAQAQSIVTTPAFEYSSAETDFMEDNFTVGYSFTFDRATTITSVGFWANGSLASSLNPSSRMVGVWASDGTLLTSTTVTTADPQSGNYRYVSVAPLSLQMGETYFIGGEALLNDLIPIFVNVTSTAVGYSWTGQAEKLGAFGFPSTRFSPDTTTGFGNQSLALVNFMVPAVPEPATWALMLVGFAAVGTSLRRRRRTAAIAPTA